MDLSNVDIALAKNKTLDQSVKDNIKELVVIFNKTFPEVSLDNLCVNLETLKVEKASSYVNHFPIDYNAKLNKLTINKKELEKANDTRNLLMNIIIRLIVSKNGIIGFDSDGSFLALNIGYIAGIANMLVGNEGDSDIYTDEIIAANIFGKIIGDDILKEAFFTNNPSLIFNKINNRGE